MDCLMPEMNGYEATEAIRALEAARGAPRHLIVALTPALLKVDLETEVEELKGAFLAKPVRRSTLDAVIDEFFGQTAPPSPNVLALAAVPPAPRPPSPGVAATLSPLPSLPPAPVAPDPEPATLRPAGGTARLAAPPVLAVLPPVAPKRSPPLPPISSSARDPPTIPGTVEIVAEPAGPVPEVGGLAGIGLEPDLAPVPPQFAGVLAGEAEEYPETPRTENTSGSVPFGSPTNQPQGGGESRKHRRDTPTSRAFSDNEDSTEREVRLASEAISLGGVPGAQSDRPRSSPALSVISSSSSAAAGGGAGAPASVPLDILVVDDVEMNRRVLATLLKKEGHRVTIACDGQVRPPAPLHASCALSRNLVLGNGGRHRF
eukprot:tig00021015_g17167.t1